MTSLTRTVLLALAIVGLAGCRPTFTLSILNASGQDLQLTLPHGNFLGWPSGSYLSFPNLNSEVVGQDGSHLTLDVLDSEGRKFRYMFDTIQTERTGSAYDLRYVVSGRGSTMPVAGVVTLQAPAACMHFQVGLKLEMSWLSRQCGRLSLRGVPPPAQPPSFPIVPVQQ